MSKYKPYPKYKDSGVEWLGQVPEDWPVIRVGYGYDVLLGKMLQPLSKEAEDRLVPYLKALNVQWENITGGPSEMWASDSEIQKFSIRKGDLLVCEGGEVGRCALVPYHPDSICIIQNSLHRVRATKGYNVNYLLRVLETANGASWFDILCNKATIAHFTRDKFVSLRIPAPDIDTQGKIAEYLNQECSHIDTIISKQEHLVDLLEEKRISIISHAVSHGTQHAESSLPTGNTWISSIPGGWKILPTRRLFSYITSGSRGWAQYYAENGDIFLRIGNLTRTAIDLDLADLQHVLPPDNTEGERTKVKTGDILISITADLGSIALVPAGIDKAYVSQHIALCRPNKTFVNSSRWLAYALFSGTSKAQFAASAYGGTKIQLSLDDIRDIDIAVPPLAEQERIATHIDLELSKIDAIISKTRQAIALAKERRAAIISAAVTGKICVTSQQKAEKPLSKSREYFQKVVLAAEITDQLHTEKTFGRVKLQKILYLSEYHAQLPFQRSEYQRYAAGPHDPKAMYSIEGQMKKQKWFDSRLRDSGYGKEYVPLERHGAYKQYYERYFTDKHSVIQRIIDLLYDKKTQFCEVIATLYGVWNDFLLEGRQPSDEEIVHDVVTNWDPKKQAISEDDWHNGLNWMRENNLVPSGWGEPTIHRQKA